MAAEESEAYRRLAQHQLASGEVSERSMMGMPSLVVAGKLYAGAAGDGLAVKVGRARADELIATGAAAAFDPSGRGRPMKDWAVLPPDARDWAALADEARAHVKGAAGAG